MKLQKSTLILLTLAALAGSGMLIYERTRGSDSTAPGITGQALFRFKENEVQTLKITSAKGNYEFERAAQPTPTTWRMVAPKPGPANDASIAFLLNAMVTGTSSISIDASRQQLAEFGLSPVTTQVTIKLKNQQQHQMILGKNTFDQGGIYALVDPPATQPEKTKVNIVPLNFLNATERPAAEWEQPPAAPSPTPSLAVPTIPSPTPSIMIPTPSPTPSQP